MLMNCGCQHYIQAQPCSTGASNLYVDARYTPNSGVMCFSSYGDCYSVDPDGERVCAPNDAEVVTLLHSQYDSCADCQSAAPPPDDPDDPPKKKSDCATVPLPNGGWTYVFPCLCLFP